MLDLHVCCSFLAASTISLRLSLTGTSRSGTNNLRLAARCIALVILAEE